MNAPKNRTPTCSLILNGLVQVTDGTFTFLVPLVLVLELKSLKTPSLEMKELEVVFCY